MPFVGADLLGVFHPAWMSVRKQDRLRLFARSRLPGLHLKQADELRELVPGEAKALLRRAGIGFRCPRTLESTLGYQQLFASSNRTDCDFEVRRMIVVRDGLERGSIV